MIKKEDVEKVRAAADLYDIVSASVTLKPSGTGTYVGLCPFHDEKTPSFSVRPSLGVWHCFGCGLGGDVFGYVEQQENIDFREAVEVLADRYHIELHYESGSGRNEHTAWPTATAGAAARRGWGGIPWPATGRAWGTPSRRCSTPGWRGAANAASMTTSAAA